MRDHPHFHVFECDSGMAYDQTQTSSEIQDGDILIVPAERIVGVMHQAWPVSLTCDHGEFHTLVDPTSFYEGNNEKYNLSFRLVKAIAAVHGWEVL